MHPASLHRSRYFLLLNRSLQALSIFIGESLVQSRDRAMDIFLSRLRSVVMGCVTSIAEHRPPEGSE